MSKNKNSRIVQQTRMGDLVTRTARRDQGETNFKISTDLQSNSSELLISGLGEQTAMKLTGRQARTLYMLLDRHMNELSAQNVSYGDYWF